MDFMKVKSLEEATAFIQHVAFKDKHAWHLIFEHGKSRVLQTIHKSTTAEEVDGGLNDFMQELFAWIQSHNDGEENLDLDLTYTCLECYTTAQMHDAVFSSLCALLERYDSQLLERSLANYGTIGEIASAVLPLTAAVVELSNLDAHTNALEKLACLCTAHDLVYAELKAALIEVQVEGEGDASSDSTGLVVVERKEVVALLVAVMARSKPSHLYTNLYYVQAFGAHLFDTPITRQIYEDFSAAVEQLGKMTGPPHQNTEIDQFRHLALSDIMTMADSDNCSEEAPCNTLQRNHMKRVLNLILTATTQHL